MQKVRVKLRSDGQFVDVPIPSGEGRKPEGDRKEDWQQMLNVIAELAGIKAALIMEITPEAMQVFLMSQNEGNPYKVGGKDYLCHGLYCESVIGQDRALEIQDARVLDAWKDNPDVAIDMIAYYGLPVKRPDGSFFGTICVLDDAPMALSDTLKALLEIFKHSMEKDLAILA